MNHIIIRTATNSDARAIALISRQTFYETFAPHNTREDIDLFFTEQFTEEALMNEVGAPGNIFLLAFAEEILAGYARLRDVAPPQGLGSNNALEIARIYVVKEGIGKGIGKALMEACLRVAQEGGKEMMWLGVWEKNSRGIDFYTKWGFQKFGEHDFVLGRDVQRDWLMKKDLLQGQPINKDK